MHQLCYNLFPFFLHFRIRVQHGCVWMDPSTVAGLILSPVSWIPARYTNQSFSLYLNRNLFLQIHFCSLMNLTFVRIHFLIKSCIPSAKQSFIIIHSSLLVVQIDKFSVKKPVNSNEIQDTSQCKSHCCMWVKWNLSDHPVNESHIR